MSVNGHVSRLIDVWERRSQGEIITVAEELPYTYTCINAMEGIGRTADELGCLYRDTALHAGGAFEERLVELSFAAARARPPLDRAIEVLKGRRRATTTQDYVRLIVFPSFNQLTPSLFVLFFDRRPQKAQVPVFRSLNVEV